MKIVLALASMLLTGCATSEEVRLRMRVQELEQALAGAQDDTGMVMRYAASQDQYIQSLESGMAEQARMAAHWRTGCDI